MTEAMKLEQLELLAPCMRVVGACVITSPVLIHGGLRLERWAYWDLCDRADQPVLAHARIGLLERFN